MAGHGRVAELVVLLGALLALLAPIAATGPRTSSVATGAAASAVTGDAAQALALQVALDRAHFSPGEIDGRRGQLTENALAAFRAEHGLAATGSQLDAETVRALGPTFSQPLTRYTITPEDAAGPFVSSIPDDLMAQAELERLGYASLLELLAERFHATPKLLTKLNPGTPLKAGATIVVPAVEPLSPPERSGQRTFDAREKERVPRAAVVDLAKDTGAVVVRDEQGKVLLYAPATVGSEQDPLPVGDWKVTGVFDLPIFNYSPDLFWDADPSHAKARIAPGPNSPVGLVWIDIDKKHFGFHGTPEPSQIGRTTSHGCVRMTNWDALRLANLVTKGTPVRLR